MTGGCFTVVLLLMVFGFLLLLEEVTHLSRLFKNGSVLVIPTPIQANFTGGFCHWGCILAGFRAYTLEVAHPAISPSE
jgi:cytochrome bd-type quinol oxidase subunit 1